MFYLPFEPSWGEYPDREYSDYFDAPEVVADLDLKGLSMLHCPRPMSSLNLPTGTVTFLFTDIENSTPLWERFPVEMETVLAAHDRLLHEAVESHSGLVVKTTGDGILAVFDMPHAALAAALAAQSALFSDATICNVGGTQIHIRAGIHTGNAQLRDGDYFGSAVNRAARLMGIGHGGQVLLSGITAGLLDGRLPTGASLLDLGDHRLRGLSRPERVFQLAAAGLPTSFPPLRTDQGPRGNLPEETTRFIGREGEVAAIRELLDHTRLLTITGPGGTGKTRLSLQVARSLEPDYRHGVWFVELASLADGDLVAQTVASLWKVSASPFATLSQQLADYLRAKQLLLILDNCEHLVSACARLAADLLPVAPELKILASSREGLGVPGESTYHLPALKVPPRSVVDPEGIQKYEAVQLFVERARSARTGFAVTAHNARAIGQIARRLDGIPLAIELAAARIKLMPPEQLAARLDDRFRLLTGGARTALPRQQTLRALIDWSYDLLDPDEQWFFRQLGVFTGGWTLEAAESMIADRQEASELDIFDLLAGLINKSLVIMNDDGGEARFDFLQTIRQYARDNLFEAGETNAARDRHLDYFGAQISALAPITSTMTSGFTMIGLADPRVPAWADRLQPELDNVRAAVEWALESNPERALMLAVDMAAWLQRCALDEGAHEWLTLPIAAVEGLPVGDEGTTMRRNWLRLSGLIAQGYLATLGGYHTSGFESYLAAVDLARQLGEEYEPALATALNAALYPGAALRSPQLAKIAAEADERFQRLEVPIGRLAPVVTLGFAGLMSGDVATANKMLDEAMAIRELVPSAFLRAFGSLALPAFAQILGRQDEARAILMESLNVFSHNVHASITVRAAKSDLAHLERRQGNDAEAEAMYRETIGEWLEYGNRPAVANQLEAFGFLAVHRGQYARAATLFGAAEALRETVDSPMTFIEQEEYGRETATLREAMDSAKLAASWGAGRSMDMETAVGFALRT